MTYSEVSNLSKPDGMSTRGRSRSCGPWFSADRAGPCALRDRTLFESTRGSTTSGGRRFWTDRGMRKHSETSNLSKPEGLPHTKRTGFCLSLCVRTSTRGFEPPTYRLGGGRSIQLSYVDFFCFPGMLCIPDTTI